MPNALDTLKKCLGPRQEADSRNEELHQLFDRFEQNKGSQYKLPRDDNTLLWPALLYEFGETELFEQYPEAAIWLQGLYLGTIDRTSTTSNDLT